MRAHFSAVGQPVYNRAWSPVMNKLVSQLQKRNYTITKDDDLMWWRQPNDITSDIDTGADVIIYANRTNDKYNRRGLCVGLQGPEPGYFSLDSIGVWPCLETTYNDKYMPVEPSFYFNEMVSLLIEGKVNHYHNNYLNPGKNSPEVNVPEDHILFILGKSQDNWQTNRSNRIWQLARQSKEHGYNVVIKIDPELTCTHEGLPDGTKLDKLQNFIHDLEPYATILTGLESLHDILKNTRVCVLDENNINLEPFMYNVPILTHGNPPYRNHVKTIVHNWEYLESLENMDWFDKERQYNWFQWYVTQHLCENEKDIDRRLDELGF